MNVPGAIRPSVILGALACGMLCIAMAGLSDYIGIFASEFWFWVTLGIPAALILGESFRVILADLRSKPKQCGETGNCVEHES